MKETTPAAMPLCFHKWCSKFDDLLRNRSQKREFRNYIGGLLGESERKIDCLLTHVEPSVATATWVTETYSQRNWIEVFYREAKCYLGLREYQVRDKKSLERHFILVFCAYTFILWHKLTGGLRRRWANKPLKTFPQALEAFRTAISYRFVAWLDKNRDVFAAYKASLGFVWA